MDVRLYKWFAADARSEQTVFEESKMEFDFLTNAVFEYLHEFISEYVPPGLANSPDDGYEWLLDSQDMVRREIVSRPNFEFYISGFYADSEKFDRIKVKIKEDSVFNSTLDSLIVDDSSSLVFDSQMILNHVMRGAHISNGEIVLTKLVISDRLESIRTFVSSKETTDILIIPLPGISVENLPFEIESNISLVQLSAKEIGKCIENRALVLLGPDQTIDPVKDGIGIRVEVKIPRTFVNLNSIEANDQPPLAGINESSEHKFGEFTTQWMNEYVEDLLFVLRLSRPEYVFASGAIFISERFNYHMVMALRRLTRHNFWSDYVLSVETGKEILQVWHDLKHQPSLVPYFPRVVERRFNDALDRSNPEDALIDYLIAAEGLFFGQNSKGEGGGEIAHKLSMRIAYFLEKDPSKRKSTFNFMKKCYGLRSQIVHGEKLKLGIPLEISGDKLLLQDFVVKLSELMRRAIVKAIPLYISDREFGTGDFWNSLVLGIEQSGN